MTSLPPPTWKTLLADRPQYALGRIVIPNIPVCDGAVYVSGDSMYPILKSGDIVGFKSIRDFTDVIYGEMYLVSFERGWRRIPGSEIRQPLGTAGLHPSGELQQPPRPHGPAAGGSQCNGHREVLDKEEYDDVEGGIITGNFVRKLLARTI